MGDEEPRRWDDRPEGEDDGEEGGVERAVAGPPWLWGFRDIVHGQQSAAVPSSAAMMGTRDGDGHVG